MLRTCSIPLTIRRLIPASPRPLQSTPGSLAISTEKHSSHNWVLESRGVLNYQIEWVFNFIIILPNKYQGALPFRKCQPSITQWKMNTVFALAEWIGWSFQKEGRTKQTQANNLTLENGHHLKLVCLQFKPDLPVGRVLLIPMAFPYPFSKPRIATSVYTPEGRQLRIDSF